MKGNKQTLSDKAIFTACFCCSNACRLASKDFNRFSSAVLEEVVDNMFDPCIGLFWIPFWKRCLWVSLSLLSNAPDFSGGAWILFLRPDCELNLKSFESDSESESFQTSLNDSNFFNTSDDALWYEEGFWKRVLVALLLLLRIISLEIDVERPSFFNLGCLVVGEPFNATEAIPLNIGNLLVGWNTSFSSSLSDDSEELEWCLGSFFLFKTLNSFPVGFTELSKLLWGWDGTEGCWDGAGLMEDCLSLCSLWRKLSLATSTLIWRPSHLIPLRNCIPEDKILIVRARSRTLMYQIRVEK